VESWLLERGPSRLPLLQFFEPCMKAWTAGCKSTTVDGLIRGVADKQDSFYSIDEFY
jgi:hypothetical protein